MADPIFNKSTLSTLRAFRRWDEWTHVAGSYWPPDGHTPPGRLARLVREGLLEQQGEKYRITDAGYEVLRP